MIILAEKNACSGCGACACACPQGCISMISDGEGFLYPEINTDKCIECEKCKKSCPVLEKNTPYADANAYAVQNNDESIRLQSSSGGFFTLLAEYVLDRGGVVFGAALSDNLSVYHVCVENKKDLRRLRGSKYVQSVIGDTYLQAKNHLNNGRLVLFTGTPCQIEGLLKFLGKTYGNLITQDIICHGAPSPDVWKKYIEWHENNSGNPVVDASFRSKKSGWKAFSMQLRFANGVEKYYSLRQDLFLKSFLSDLCLRPSCYSCSFKSKLRASDFTLADFWGVHNFLPETDDDKGTSLVLVFSQKAADIFDELKPRMAVETVDFDEALKYNSAATKSVAQPDSRKHFMSEIKSDNFEAIVNKYCPEKSKSVSFTARVLRKIKKMLDK